MYHEYPKWVHGQIVKDSDEELSHRATHAAKEQAHQAHEAAEEARCRALAEKQVKAEIKQERKAK